MGLGDVFDALFRHKWMIGICSLAGIVGAGVVYQTKQPPFQSEAKVFIRYVLESKSPNPTKVDNNASMIVSPDEQGAHILNSEIEILTSLDVVKQVVNTVGAEKILARVGGGKDANVAAAMIRKNLLTEIPPKSSVIRVVFQHPDPDILQPVLGGIVDSYIKKHAEVHRAINLMDDFLTQQTDQMRTRLTETEQELRKAKNRVGVITLEDTKKGYEVEIAKLRDEIFSAQASLAERSALLKELTRLAPARAFSTNSQAETPPEKVAEYKGLCERLDLLRKKDVELRTQFTEENVLVKGNREQMKDIEQRKRTMEKETPKLSLSNTDLPQVRLSDRPWWEGSVNLSTEAAQVNALAQRINELTLQLSKVRSEATNVVASEAMIIDLERKKGLEEENFRYFSASLEQARIDDALGTGKISNIGIIQTPSAPFRDTMKLFKLMGMVLLGGIGAGIGLAFFTEMFFVRSVRSAVEIEGKLKLPLMLAIPDVSKRRLGKGRKEPMPLPDGRPPQPVPSALSAAPGLQPFVDSLQNRLVTYFRLKNVAFKTKLIGVTHISKNSGASTLALGLASSFSESGAGKALFVDMSSNKDAAEALYRGEARRDLKEVLTATDNGPSQERLHVAAEDHTAPTMQFSEVVQKLRESQYGFVVFDLPRLNLTSPTPHLAGFMDIVLLVVEAEEDSRDAVQQASRTLTESKANVHVVLNKLQSYAPSWLQQGSLGYE